MSESVHSDYFESNGSIFIILKLFFRQRLIGKGFLKVPSLEEILDFLSGLFLVTYWKMLERMEVFLFEIFVAR